MHHIEGTPWGTRGGISVVHTFPADGEYTFRVMLHGTPVGELFGSVASRNEQLEISINGARAALLDIDYRMSEKEKSGLNLITPRIHVTAGPQRIAAAFISKFDGVIDDLVAPIDYTLADTEYGDSVGITDPAARARPQHHRSADGDRRFRYAEPPQGVRLPPDVAG